MFQSKQLLVEWNWQPFEIRVDLEQSTLSIADYKVVSVHAHDRECNVEFTSGWADRLSSPELTKIINECVLKMQARKIGKGVGKTSPNRS